MPNQIDYYYTYILVVTRLCTFFKVSSGATVSIVVLHKRFSFRHSPFRHLLLNATIFTLLVKKKREMMGREKRSVGVAAIE